MVQKAYDPFKRRFQRQALTHAELHEPRPPMRLLRFNGFVYLRVGPWLVIKDGNKFLFGKAI
jgi:hypothetical protein